MENYLVVDLLILGFILISAGLSFFRGFSHEILSAINWIIALFGIYNFGDKLINFINKFINNLFISNGISYFKKIFYFFFIYHKKFANLVKKSDVGFIDRTGGFFLDF